MTSAMALSQVLTAISVRGPSHERFVSVAADILGIEEADREVKALLAICHSIREVRTDVEALPFHEDQKALLISMVLRFWLQCQ